MKEYTKKDVNTVRRAIRSWGFNLHEHEIASLARMLVDERSRTLSGFVRHMRKQYPDQEYTRDVKRDVAAYRRRMR